MKTVRWLTLGLGIGVLLSFAPSCGQSGACGPLTCFGCCDATGLCVSGTTDAVCGSAGASCSACSGATLCAVGSCVAALPAGGDDAGTGDGGTDAGYDAGIPTPTNPLGFTVTIIPDPARRGSNAMSVLIKSANDLRVPGATLTAQTWMPAMGHGSATPSVVEEGAGLYTVSNVSFTMGGTWEVTLTASAPGGLSGSQKYSYAVP
ncbi:MAG: FixH family protein [Myxococcaceae bacterium]